jgi:protein SCO1/2
VRTALVLTLVVLSSLMLLQPRDDPHDISQEQQLPKIAPAPGFTLTSQDGVQISLADLRGKVVAVTFIFTLCTATCPVLTPMMSLVQGQLGPVFGNQVVFASITVDPERDTPEMLKLYAQTYGADVAGWSFLTGPPPVIADLTRRYGVFASKNANGDIEHSFLTSIVDRRSILRVQYLGVRFDPAEFRRDLLSLLRER